MKLLELVPRSVETLLEEAQMVAEQFPQIDGFNVPDILRVPLRSHDAALALLKKNHLAIPHIRCIDRPIEDTVEIIQNLVDHGLQKVLLIRGDVPIKLSRTVYDICPLKVIEATQKACPNLDIYAALDPYRSSMIDELHYLDNKVEAGAKGAFSQPFFNPLFAEVYLDKLQDIDFFLGISPVLSDISFNYWEQRNKVVFPSTFSLTPEYSIQTSKSLIALAERYKQNLYFMPIKTDLKAFLTGIFS